MSKAFTREENEGAEIAELPPPSSALPAGTTNYITAQGAERLRIQLAHLVETERPPLVDLARNDPDSKRRLSILDQRIGNLEQTLGNAQVVTHTPGPAPRVTFGATVRVREQPGAISRYRIVGVDETDAEQGWISWLSPLARALINAQVGARVRFTSPAGKQEFEVLEIVYE